MKWVNLLVPLSVNLVLSCTQTATVSPLLRSASADWLAFPTPEQLASSKYSLCLRMVGCVCVGLLEKRC